MKDINEQLDIEREKINSINFTIIKLLEKRFLLVKNIAEIKQVLNIPIFQSEREKQILENIGKISTNSEFIIPIFQRIIQQSRKFQKEVST